MEDARKRNAGPETRIWKFTTLVHSKTIDPVATLMKYSEKDIRISGSALFNGDKMVGEIDTNQTGLLHALMAEKINFEYFYRNEDSHDPAKVKNGAAILLKSVKRNVKIDISENKPKIDISLDFKATLDEYDINHNLDEKETQKKFEEDAAKSIKKNCTDLIKYLQEIGSDPLGLGEMVRVKHNTFYKSVDWEKIYKDVVINVDVKLNVEFYGAVK
jgi:spore germination protein